MSRQKNQWKTFKLPLENRKKTTSGAVMVLVLSSLAKMACKVGMSSIPVRYFRVATSLVVSVEAGDVRGSVAALVRRVHIRTLLEQQLRC